MVRFQAIEKALKEFKEVSKDLKEEPNFLVMGGCAQKVQQVDNVNDLKSKVANAISIPPERVTLFTKNPIVVLMGEGTLEEYGIKQDTRIFIFAPGMAPTA